MKYKKSSIGNLQTNPLSTYPITYMSAGLLTSNQLSTSRSSGGSFPPTFHEPTHTLETQNTAEKDKNMINRTSQTLGLKKLD